MGKAKHSVYLCIGGNEGDREANLEETLDFLDFNFGDLMKTSSVYESEAWGMENAEPFLNQVVRIESELTPEGILQEIAELEEYYGRERKTGKYLPREMDVDILFYDTEIIETEKLQVPHPRLHLRRFVLEPLNEIASGFIHPTLKKTVAELLKECEDKSLVKKL